METKPILPNIGAFLESMVKGYSIDHGDIPVWFEWTAEINKCLDVACAVKQPVKDVLVDIQQASQSVLDRFYKK